MSRSKSFTHLEENSHKAHLRAQITRTDSRERNVLKPRYVLTPDPSTSDSIAGGLPSAAFYHLEHLDSPRVAHTVLLAARLNTRLHSPTRYGIHTANLPRAVSILRPGDHLDDAGVDTHREDGWCHRHMRAPC